MRTHDFIQRFHFADLGVRGAIVRLSNSFVESLNGRAYPDRVNAVIGECLAASTLMAVNLKQPSLMSIHAKGSGPLRLLMAEADHQPVNTPDLETAATKTSHSDNETPIQTIRAAAKIDNEKLPDDFDWCDASLTSMLGNANLAITIEPRKGQRYQGIVDLSNHTLSLALENYFAQSEQLPTKLVLTATNETAAGLLLQRMPSERHAESSAVLDDSWETLAVLVDTLTPSELQQLASETLLHRLFHQYPLHVQAACAITFACRCSQQRTGQALLQVDRATVEQILREDGEIVMDCDLCSARYRFDHAAIAALRTAANAAASGTTH